LRRHGVGSNQHDDSLQFDDEPVIEYDEDVLAALEEGHDFV